MPVVSQNDYDKLLTQFISADKARLEMIGALASMQITLEALAEVEFNHSTWLKYAAPMIRRIEAALKDEKSSLRLIDRGVLDVKKLVVKVQHVGIDAALDSLKNAIIKQPDAVDKDFLQGVLSVMGVVAVMAGNTNEAQDVPAAETPNSVAVTVTTSALTAATNTNISVDEPEEKPEPEPEPASKKKGKN